MARNLLLDAMQGYKFVDDIQRQDEMDKERMKDRQLDQQWQQESRGRQREQWGAEDETKKAEVNMINSIFGEDLAQKSNESVGSDLGYRKAWTLATNPELNAGILTLADDISEDLNAGKMPDSAKVAAYMNMAGSPELEERAQKQGLQSLVVNSVVPDPEGKGVMVDFIATDKDGKHYNAPMTKGASRESTDDQVETIAMEQLMAWFGGSREAARKLMEAQAKAGNPVVLNKYRELRAGLINKKVERKEKIEEEIRKQKMGREDKVFEQKLGQEDKQFEWKNKPKEPKGYDTVKGDDGEIYVVNKDTGALRPYGSTGSTGGVKGYVTTSTGQAFKNKEAKELFKNLPGTFLAKASSGDDLLALFSGGDPENMSPESKKSIVAAAEEVAGNQEATERERAMAKLWLEIGDGLGVFPKQAAPKPDTPAKAEQGTPVPQTQADFDKLPPGSVYKDPDDGKLYRKP